MKIGKNNFRPPPAVESSVVRLVPKRPRPQISWEEWDGLLRVCFVRKNKTLRAGFLGTSTVMEMLEANYKTYCAQNDVPIEDGPAEQNAVTGKEAQTKGFPDDISEEHQETPSVTTSHDTHIALSADATMAETHPSPSTSADSDTEWNGFDTLSQFIDDDEEQDQHQPTETMEIDDNDTLPPFFQDEAQNAKARTLNAKPGSKRNRKGKVAMLIKEKVNRVLDETELGDKRARMCDEGDFLRLLWGFNEEGIHFS